MLQWRSGACGPETPKGNVTRWLLLGIWSRTDVVRAEPFDALELELTILWED